MNETQKSNSDLPQKYDWLGATPPDDDPPPDGDGEPPAKVREFPFAEVDGVRDTAPECHTGALAEIADYLHSVGESLDSKDGPAFVGAELDGEGRSDANVKAVTWLTLDIEESPGTIPELQGALTDYARIVYTTRSHGVREVEDPRTGKNKKKWKPGEPRFRVLAPYKRAVTAAEHAVIFDHFERVLDGAPDPATRNPSRVQYMPRKKHPDADRDPLFELHDDLPLLDPDALPDGDGGTVSVEELAKQQADQASADRTQRSDAPTRSNSSKSGDWPDDPEEWREVLFAIPADVDSGLTEEKWLKTIWAFAHEYGDDDRARDLLHEWSATAPDDYDPEALEDKWRRGLERECDNPTTLATVVHYARELGDYDGPTPGSGTTDVEWSHASKTFFLGEDVGEKSLNDDGDRAIFASDVWPVGKAVKPNGEHGAMIRFLPEGEGRARERFISAKAWNDNQKSEAATLAAEGVKIVPDKGPALLRLVGLWTRFEAERIIRVADRSGWHFTEGGALYVNGAYVYGADDLGVEWRAEGPHTERRGRERGDFDEWQQGIADLATTDGLRFMLGLSLAGPFVGGLKIIGRDVGSFMPHFCGPSSTGKSKGAKLAQSVWSGGALPSWNATKNAVENLAEFSSGALLVLDEIKEAQSWAVKKIIHIFSDGAGRAKQRRDRNALRRNLEWSAVGISTGENTVSQVLGDDYQGGHAVRSPDLWCDRGDLCTDREHADQIGRLAARHYGAAGNRWAETLADWTPDDWHDLESEMDGWRDDFADLVVDDPEAGRILDHFILAAVAYRRAAVAGVLPFGAEQADEHARSFLRWAMGKVRDQRGEATNPDARAYQNLRRSLATQPNRFPAENDYRKGDVRGAVVGIAETDQKAGKTGAVWLCSALANDSDEFKGAGTNWQSFRQWAEGEGLILEEKTPGRVGGVNRRWKKIALDGMADESSNDSDEKISIGLSVVG